ncbi:MAG: polysaccharide biosynthesis protein [Gammaproteobacteria bacterium]|nr:polysaccharide biosynthesis protein [Gammaproteobacteria bacterium]
MVPVAWMGSYWLRFNLNEVPAEMWNSAMGYLIVVAPVQAAVFWSFGLYRGVWRFASMPDLLRIVRSIAVGLVVTLLILFVIYRLEGIPRSVPILYGLLLIILLGGPRLLYRWLKDHRVSFSGGNRILIVGAGRAGEMLARDLLREHSSSYMPVAFVDDKPRRKGQDIHGIPIVGSCDEIPEVAERLEIDVILLSVPSARVKEKQHLVELCEKTGLPFRTVPQLQDLMSGQVAINQLRKVSIEDLLGRESVNLDWKEIRSSLSGKIILVTGAGGSIGSELCRQIAEMEPASIVLLENCEFNLYLIEEELNGDYPALSLQACLGDVRDVTLVNHIFKKFRPEIVFHAAAYKQVPMLESQIREAVRNNVLGTRLVADAADRSGCAKFVLISTDKAVNPANIMGITKRVAEIYCQNLNSRSKTQYTTVRFGNVLGSAGSVVPLFRKQIAAGGPVTVTHQDIKRFFMTIPEACQLIMQSAVMSSGGEIFVLDMGEPVRISYLAEQMIRLSGKIPGEDIQIEFIGLRPGEKLFEELFHEEEQLEPTSHEKVLLASYRKVDWLWLTGVLDRVSEFCTTMDIDSLHEQLVMLVPESARESAESWERPPGVFAEKTDIECRDEEQGD